MCLRPLRVAKIPFSRLAWLALTVLFSWMGVAAGAQAAPPISAKEFIEVTTLKSHKKRLKRGEIVLIKRPEREADAELVVFMAVLVPSPLGETIEELQLLSAGTNDPGLLDMQEITSRQASPALAKQFERVSFGPPELDEVKKLMKIAPGGSYNLSRSEIARFRQAAGKIPTDKPEESGPEAMAAILRSTMQEISGLFEQRIKGYRALSDRKEQAGPSRRRIDLCNPIAGADQRAVFGLLSDPSIFSGAERPWCGAPIFLG